MIQRQQTLWLLLATTCAILTFFFPFVTGEEFADGSTTIRQPGEVTAGRNFFFLILTIASICLSTVAIFYFKDRKLQMRLCLIGLLIALTVFILYILEMRKFASGTLALWSLLSLAVIISYFMAYRGIRHDERLVKSLDKLR